MWASGLGFLDPRRRRKKWERTSKWLEITSRQPWNLQSGQIRSICYWMHPRQNPKHLWDASCNADSKWRRWGVESGKKKQSEGLFHEQRTGSRKNSQAQAACSRIRSLNGCDILHIANIRIKKWSVRMGERGRGRERDSILLVETQDLSIPSQAPLEADFSIDNVKKSHSPTGYGYGWDHDPPR